MSVKGSTNGLSKPRTARPRARAGTRARERTRLLLVDDHPLLRSGVRAFLDAEPDLQVLAEADNGLQAVKMARELAIDIVIMDVVLPQLGGAEATKQILEAKPATRVLALSAHEDVALARLMFGAGATGYALKRNAGDTLLRAVRSVAAGRRYFDPLLVGSLAPTRHRRKRHPDQPELASLSNRELEVVRSSARGVTSKELADQLGVSHRTLETYRARAMAKLNLHSRAELIRYAAICGWLRGS